MRVLAVIQARVGSTRLPNKVLLPLSGRPLLQRVIERVQAASTIDEIVVAPTTCKDDDAIREVCRGLSVQVYSGHPTDLLDRHYRAGRFHSSKFWPSFSWRRSPVWSPMCPAVWESSKPSP